MTTTISSCPGAAANSVKPSSFTARTTAQPKNKPMARPSSVPNTAMITDSQRTADRTCDRLMPTARKSPSSRVRS